MIQFLTGLAFVFGLLGFVATLLLGARAFTRGQRKRFPWLARLDGKQVQLLVTAVVSWILVFGVSWFREELVRRETRELQRLLADDFRIELGSLSLAVREKIGAQIRHDVPIQDILIEIGGTLERQGPEGVRERSGGGPPTNRSAADTGAEDPRLPPHHSENAGSPGGSKPKSAQSALEKTSKTTQGDGTPQPAAPGPERTLDAFASRGPQARTEPMQRAVAGRVEAVSSDVLARFTPSGWMGDAQQGQMYLQFEEASNENPHSGPSCVKVVYAKPGPLRWAGVYWLHPPENWGDIPGVNLQAEGYAKLTLWARGRSGGEVVEFKAGGIRNPGKPYQDSFSATTGNVTLSDQWQRFAIDLRGADLSSVIGGFCWVASASSNPNGLTFYIDDVHFQQ